MKYRALSWLTLSAVGVALVIGCSQRRSEPIRGPLVLTEQKHINGERLYMANCHQCHPNGERGLGPSLNDKPLPGFMIKNQVRMGGGAMPPFSREQISDEQLDNLVAYMGKLREH